MKHVAAVEKVMSEQFPQFKYVVIDSFFTGPYSNRVPTKVMYVEFTSSDAATKFCNHVKTSRNSKIQVSGNEITVKFARTKINGARDYSLRAACELIKKQSISESKQVEIKWGTDRHITVDKEVVFQQDKIEVGGTFMAPYDGLVMQ